MRCRDCRSLVIVFREGVRAGLIVGIVMAVTSRRRRRGRWIRRRRGRRHIGRLRGGGCLPASVAIFSWRRPGLFNACILGFAVLMLGWHNVWMARHGRELAAEMLAAGEGRRRGSKSSRRLPWW